MVQLPSHTINSTSNWNIGAQQVHTKINQFQLQYRKAQRIHDSKNIPIIPLEPKKTSIFILSYQKNQEVNSSKPVLRTANHVKIRFSDHPLPQKKGKQQIPPNPSNTSPRTTPIRFPYLFKNSITPSFAIFYTNN